MTAAHQQPPGEPGAAEPEHEGLPAAEQAASPPEQAPELEHDGVAEHEGEPERCGPLLVERHRKADGRQLILYRRVADDG